VQRKWWEEEQGEGAANGDLVFNGKDIRQKELSPLTSVKSKAEISSLAIQERKTLGLTTDGRLTLRAERGAGEGERTARDIDREVNKESSSTYLWYHFDCPNTQLVVVVDSWVGKKVWFKMEKEFVGK
jgi:hypothetical protein